MVALYANCAILAEMKMLKKSEPRDCSWGTPVLVLIGSS